LSCRQYRFWLAPSISRVDPLNSREPEQTRWFTEQVLPHEAALRAYLRSHFPTLQDIDDLVQEAYARLFRAREAGNVHNARSYLFVTARNAALDHFRHRRVEALEPLTESTVSSVYTDGSSTPEIASINQELEILMEAIRTLPDRCREVLMLRRIYDLSHKEIADRLGITEHTVEKQVGIGLRRCAKFLRRRGVLTEEQAHGVE
jgi:RNA polymerase sigma factor (sigma-70 family)